MRNNKGQNALISVVGAEAQRAGERADAGREGSVREGTAGRCTPTRASTGVVAAGPGD